MAEKQSDISERNSFMAQRGTSSLNSEITPLKFPKTGKLVVIRLHSEVMVARVTDSLRKCISVEFEQGLPFNLLPVFLGLGISIYFAIPEEPSLLALFGACVCLALLMLRQENRGIVFHSVAALSLVLSGMLIAKVAVKNTAYQAVKTTLTTNVTAVVLAVDYNRRGAPRYLVKPVHIAKWSEKDLPIRLKLSASGKKSPSSPGDVISGLARIQPVLGPVIPGGYDFSFFARFAKLGGSGFFMGSPIVTKPKTGYKLKRTEAALIWINNIRLYVAQRIQRNIPGSTGKIATALVIGDKSGIPTDIQDALRATGLAHILAISGLHMALVTLTIIWLVRFILATGSTAPLRYPVKKWAAAAGLAFATLYLMLSGAGVATQRAWIMICVMLFAVLADRKAVTMRSVSISALLILLTNPQNILMPGFQMSFAAVIALVATYQTITEWRHGHTVRLNSFENHGIIGSLIRIPITYLGGIALTSLVAGIATSFVAAWHFQQFAPLGLLANLLVMPIVTTIVMPAVLVAIVLIPFGLEFLALYPVALGIEWVVGIAFWVEELGPAKATGLIPGMTYVLFLLVLLLLTQLRTRLRMLAFLPLAAIPFSITRPDVPDVLIAESGRTVAVKGADSAIIRLLPKRENFVSKNWGKAYQNGKVEFANLPKDACNKDRCIAVLRSSHVLHIVYDPKLLSASCKRADILVAPRLNWVNCHGRTPQLVLKRGDFEEKGTHAIYIGAPGQDRKHNPVERRALRIDTAISGHNRAWSRKYSNHP